MAEGSASTALSRSPAAMPKSSRCSRPTLTFMVDDDDAGDGADDRRQEHQPDLAAAHQRAQPVGHRKTDARQEPRRFVCGDLINRHGAAASLMRRV